MGNKKTFRTKWSDGITKSYLYLCGFVVFGFVIWLLITLANKLGFMPTKYSIFNNIVYTFMTVWGIAFAFTMPLGIITLGIKSILDGESIVQGPNKPESTYGLGAVVAGVFYLTLGLIFFWGVNGVIWGVLCQSNWCSLLPGFIKFF